MAINPSNTRPDSEHNYTGTNFAVATVMVLLVLVGGYFLVANINDVTDDSANGTVTEFNGVGHPTAGAY